LEGRRWCGGAQGDCVSFLGLEGGTVADAGLVERNFGCHGSVAMDLVRSGYVSPDRSDLMVNLICQQHIDILQNSKHHLGIVVWRLCDEPNEASFRGEASFGDSE
jgi:hypothetical protein